MCPSHDASSISTVLRIPILPTRASCPLGSFVASPSRSYGLLSLARSSVWEPVSHTSCEMLALSPLAGFRFGVISDVEAEGDL